MRQYKIVEVGEIVAKKSTTKSLFRRIIALVKRHPGKTITGVVLFFGGIPTAAAGYSMMVSFIDPMWPASHGWVREWGAPILQVQNTQALSIDRFLLYQQSEALAKAQADPAFKTSPIVQERIKDLNGQVQDTQRRIEKALRK